MSTAKSTRTRQLFEPLEPSTSRRLQGWVQAAHPFPLAMVVCLTALIGVASSSSVVFTGRFITMLAAMLFSQLAIGWTNDYVDHQTDAMYQPTKPIPAGALDASAVPAMIVIAIFVSFTLGTVLGPVPLGLLAIGTGAGLAYDLALKNTRYSPAAFLVAFAVLPPFVWTSLDLFRDELLVLYLIASPLVVAVHLANVLPDYESDTAAGRSNLVVVLGRERAFQALGDSLAAPPLLVAVTLPWLDYSRGLLAVTLLAYSLACAAAAWTYGKQGRDALVWGFRFLALSGVILVTGWLASV